MKSKNPHALISDLINMAKADGKLSDAEYDFIQTLATRMQVSSKELDSLFKNPQPFQQLNSELERITHFYRLVLVMNLDQTAHANEVATLRSFGLKMGIRHDVVDQILVTMEKYEDRIIPAEKLLEIFKTYYN